MLVALVVVPGIALGYLLVAPRGRLRALRQLLAGGAAMALVGGAWPALMALTPASQRPWISETSDNSIFSLIFEYNGLGRVDGQAGGPPGAGGGGGGTMFGGSSGPLRLLNSALGGPGRLAARLCTHQRDRPADRDARPSRGTRAAAG